MLPPSYRGESDLVKHVGARRRLHREDLQLLLIPEVPDGVGHVTHHSHGPGSHSVAEVALAAPRCRGCRRSPRFCYAAFGLLLVHSSRKTVGSRRRQTQTPFERRARICSSSRL